jgi:hypothetical protein
MEDAMDEFMRAALESYERRVREIEATEVDAPWRKSPWWKPLECTMLATPCGCTIEGDGNIPSPLRIKFCRTHAVGGLAMVARVGGTRTTILANVLAAMQVAEELGGPEGGDYVALMDDILAEASDRRDRAVGRK